jgi:hypothetical protein
MKLGEFVHLFIAGTGPHIAEVAWRQGDRVGLEFARLLSEKVFQKLVAEDWEGARAAEGQDSAGAPIRRFI